MQNRDFFFFYCEQKRWFCRHWILIKNKNKVKKKKSNINSAIFFRAASNPLCGFGSVASAMAENSVLPLII